MPEFVHLHVHSDYSLLDGAAPIPDLVAKAKGMGMTHLAITDHGSMFGALRFYKECKANGIVPIIGSEFYVAPDSRLVKSGTETGSRAHHLVLIAKNTTGYQNLIKLSSIGYTEGFYYKPRIDDEVLSQHSEGLICLSACLAGEIPAYLLNERITEAETKAARYREVFGPENFYLELQDHGLAEQQTVNRGILELHRRMGIPLVATNDSHYIERSDANSQDILICIGTNKKRSESKRMRFESQEFYLKSADEMARVFDGVPEALSNTLRIAEQCDVEIPLPGPMLPDYRIPQDFSSPEDYLRHLAMEGLKDRYPDVTEEHRKRVDYELSIIMSMGFTGYFLIVWDFIDYARRNGIPVGPGRGSGAGSLVAYSLKITDIDPLKYNLLFERFLNPERVSMPDFDIDFCFERRQEVIDYVTRKYGKEKVGQIITFGTLKARAVIRDVARVLDVPYAEADSIAKLVPPGPKVKLSAALESEQKLKELAERDGVYRELMETSKRLEGLSRHASTHAAGIVIGKDDLTSYVPLYRDPKTGSISTQYTMDQLEECGLVKMDFLGLKTLTLIKNTVELIRRRGIDFDIEAIPEDDTATFSLLGEGKSTCVFQFESSGMQAILKRAKPTKIEDLIALNALYRPGPMAFIDQFIDSKWGRQPITYPLPELESVLEETYGVIVYQEQVMEIAQIVGGYTLGQADILRRAMGKKKVEEMAKQKELFIQGAEAKGYTKKQAVEIFDLLVPFAGYGFNKSHAAAYSVLAYKTAYLKANYPAEFMAANLTNEITNTEKLTEYIAETRSMGIDILAPDVNLSEKYFTVADDKVVYGLVGIKNIGAGAVDEILRARKEDGSFTSFMDFLERVDLRTVNRKAIETLVQSGTFDSLSTNRATLMHNLEAALEVAAKNQENKLYGQASLFDGAPEELGPDFEMQRVPEWPKLDLLQYEADNLGFYFSGHPLDTFRRTWEKSCNLDLSRAERASTEKQYTLVGMLKTVREIQTKQGRRMAFASLEDYRGSIELVFFSDQFERFSHLLVSGKVVGVLGKVDLSRGEPKLKVDELKEPEEVKRPDLEELHIRFHETQCDEDELIDLRAYLCEHQGQSPVYIHLARHNGHPDVVVRASSQITVSPGNELLSYLRGLPRVEEAWTE